MTFIAKKGERVKLVKILDNAPQLKIGSIGIVIGCRKLVSDVEEQRLIKWNGKAGPIACNLSDIMEG